MEFETLAWGYTLIEGPRVDADDTLYFSDVHRGGVYARDREGTIRTVVPRRRGVGGIALHADGGIVLSGRNICHVRDGETRVLHEADDVGGWNDLFTDADGRILAGSLRDDPFSLDDGPRRTGDLVRISGPGQADLLYDDVRLSNGIGFSPAGDRLYHSDTVRAGLIVHDVAPDGAVSKRRTLDLGEAAPDGLAVDAEGFVWVAVYGGSAVWRVSPEGKIDRQVPVPARAVTSLCFGGRDLRDLYVVSADNLDDPDRGGTIFRTRSDVAGLPAPLARI